VISSEGEHLRTSQDEPDSGGVKFFGGASAAT
jgi:hypothetical protein